MEEKPYIRVRGAYYKFVNVPTISGNYYKILTYWPSEAIRQDHDKAYIASIKKYDGFACIPSHVDFKQVYGTFYNKYHPLSKKPKEGAFENTIIFLKHIFGSQYELGLDYLQLLYLQPVQILPILCLVSQERSTGKSTFLKWLKCVFEDNLTYLTNDSFSSQFNADWANKLLICIDEVLFNKEELTERIKYLSTTNINKLEAKGKDKREVEFFGKFILCSNKEDSFIKIDANETRFWVRKVPSIKSENTSFLDELVVEIPAFLFFLSKRKLSCNRKTRMWFRPQDIRTEALLRLMRSNRSRVEKELASILFCFMEKFELKEIHFSLSDALNLMTKSRVKTDITQLRKILKSEWSLESEKNSNPYQKPLFTNQGELEFMKTKGRYYSISKAFLSNNFDDLMTE